MEPEGTEAFAAASGTMVPGHAECSEVPVAGVRCPAEALVAWENPAQLEGLSG